MHALMIRDSCRLRPDSSSRSSTRIGSERSMLEPKDFINFHHRHRRLTYDSIDSPWRARTRCRWPARNSSRASSAARRKTTFHIWEMKFLKPPGAVRDSMPISLASSKASSRSPWDHLRPRLDSAGRRFVHWQCSCDAFGRTRHPTAVCHFPTPPPLYLIGPNQTPPPPPIPSRPWFHSALLGSTRP